MPVLEVRSVPSNESELPFQFVPATAAGVAVQVCDFSQAQGSMGKEVVRVTGANGSGGNVTLRDGNGRTFTAMAGQPIEWDLGVVPEGQGAKYINVTGDAAIAANQVQLVLRVRRGG